MTIFYSQTGMDKRTAACNGKGADSAETTMAKTIDMKAKSRDNIWGEFLSITKAVEVAATEEEAQQLRELAEASERSERDRQDSKAMIAERRREEVVLEQARQAVA